MQRPYLDFVVVSEFREVKEDRDRLCLSAFVRI